MIKDPEVGRSSLLLMPLGTDKSTFQRNETCSSTLNGIVISEERIFWHRNEGIQLFE